MPKRILIFSLAYFPKHVGGAEVALKEITDRLAPEDIEFHLVTLRFDATLPKVEKVGNVLVHRIGFTRPSPSMADLRRFPLHLNKALFQFAAAIEAARLHRRYRYDATWAMMAHSCGVPAALFKLFHPSVPYLLTLQEGDPPERIVRTMRPFGPLFRLAFRSADALQAISTFLARWGTSMGFRGRPVLIPNGVDVARFSRPVPPEILDAVSRRIGRRPGEILVITSSRLVTKNGLADVIDAMARLPERFRFLILGTGPLEEELKAQAQRLGVEGRVSFLGHVGHEELPAWLQLSDIFTRPSLSEGMGNSFVEAMTAGLPVVATQEGGIADFLFDPERNPDRPPTGLAVAPRDPDALARQFQRLADDAALRERLVTNGRALVAGTYEWDRIAASMRREFFGPALGLPPEGER